MSLFVFVGVSPAEAQVPDFTIDVVELPLSNAPRIHSTAVAEHNGLWVFVSGRIDGLHILFGGPDAFPAAMANNSILVYDPADDQLWSASLDELPDSVADPLRTTNGQFWQDGDTLYYIGGYGYEHATDGKITFGVLTAVDVPGIIDAVQNATPLSPHIRQTGSDDRLKVTGGHLIWFDGQYHLVGGNRFDGEYIGGFAQVYTEAVRSFVIDDDGSTLGIYNFSETVDTANFHRRDLNVSPVILDDGSEGFAIFGGVFQIAQNLPFRSPIYFSESAIDVDTGFEAQFGHYTQPVIPLYDEMNSTMHTVFIGGMNQFYYDETDEMIKEDRLVPFVDDVTAISRNSAGITVETVLPITLPVLIGTNSAFFPNESLETYGNGVIKLDAITERTLVGHMIGGIESSAPNAGTYEKPTEASNRVFGIYVTGTTSIEAEGPNTFEVLPPFPNPFTSEVTLRIRTDAPETFSIEIYDMLGRRVDTLSERSFPVGTHTFTFDGNSLAAGVYVLRVAGEHGITTHNLVHLD
ncbi:MAG: T9SS type A sorting domain-containing protein [Rubricoccaceae bacterium]|nr:T9SS type A sorting domain-containing protein [Rubricoccaceae bacterium]